MMFQVIVTLQWLISIADFKVPIFHLVRTQNFPKN